MFFNLFFEAEYFITILIARGTSRDDTVLYIYVYVVKPMGHGSYIMGHGSVFVWVSGSCDPLPALEYCTVRVYELHWTGISASPVLGHNPYE